MINFLFSAAARKAEISCVEIVNARQAVLNFSVWDVDNLRITETNQVWKGFYQISP
jgi:hypothetical protein